MKELTVYYLPLDRALQQSEQAALWEILPYERRQRLTRTLETKHDQVLCAYGLLRWCLLEEYGLNTLPKIQVAEGGKPFFPDLPDLHFSISHTDGGVVCALFDRPVGVDLEKERTAALSLMTHYRCSDQHAFWQMWVHREAVGKYHGQGFARLVHWEGDLEEGLFCRQLPLPAGYCGAVATSAAVPPCLRSVTLEQMLSAAVRR